MRWCSLRAAAPSPGVADVTLPPASAHHRPQPPIGLGLIVVLDVIVLPSVAVSAVSVVRIVGGRFSAREAIRQNAGAPVGELALRLSPTPRRYCLQIAAVHCGALVTSSS